MKLIAPPLIQALSAAPVLGLSPSLSYPVEATSPPTLLSQIQYKPPTPPDRGTPGGRGEGASRGPCQPINKPSLTALVPATPARSASTQSSQPATSVWGLTSAEHPTVWVYVPYAQEAISAEFVLQDEADNDIYRSAIKPAGVAGVIGVQVPNTIAPLQPGKLYHWFFKIRVACSPTQPPALDYVEGWVQRTTPDTVLTNQLKQASPRQKAALYAQNGIWYEALTALAELRLANPNDPVTLSDWTGFLKGAGLGETASTPIIKP